MNPMKPAVVKGLETRIFDRLQAIIRGRDHMINMGTPHSIASLAHDIAAAYAQMEEDKRTLEAINTAFAQKEAGIEE